MQAHFATVLQSGKPYLVSIWRCNGCWQENVSTVVDLMIRENVCRLSGSLRALVEMLSMPARSSVTKRVTWDANKQTIELATHFPPCRLFSNYKFHTHAFPFLNRALETEALRASW